jgi:hypothetical protein
MSEEEQQLVRQAWSKFSKMLYTLQLNFCSESAHAVLSMTYSYRQAHITSKCIINLGIMIKSLQTC